MKNRETIEQYTSAHYEEAVALLEALGRIPAPTRWEDKRAAFCRDWFQFQGGENTWIDKAKNAICAINVDESNDLAVFMAHTDVVFEDTEELPMRREGDILYAPGIGDDTANLVNLMMATKYFLGAKAKPPMGILVVANACEEGLGNLDGCKEIINTYGDRIKAFYSFDGYLSQCTDIPVGSHRFQISVHAQGGHSYLDFGKENAIAVMAELIGSLYGVEPPKLEKTTYNVGTIQGGSTVNSIAQKCQCLYEYRSPMQKCLDIMRGELDAIVEDYRQRGHRVDLELLGVRPGMGEFEAGILEAYTDQSIRCIREFFQGELDRGPYSTDSNVPLSMGIPANTIGTVVGGKAHTREEWVDITSLQVGMGIVMSLMDSYWQTN